MKGSLEIGCKHCGENFTLISEDKPVIKAMKIIRNTFMVILIVAGTVLAFKPDLVAVFFSDAHNYATNE